MEIKIDNDWVKLEKGDVIGDESEEGIGVCILVEDGEIEFGVSDMKEGWSLKLDDVKKVNGEWIRKSEEGDVFDCE
jgi:hypothetical protein